MLSQCTEWLAEQGIKERLDLVELDLSDLRGAEKWEAQVIQFARLFDHSCLSIVCERLWLTLTIAAISPWLTVP